MVVERWFAKLANMTKHLLKMYMKKEEAVDGKVKRSQICISKRQWALLLSTVYLIISGLITIIGVLVSRHNTEVFDMLLGDFDNERSKHSCTDPLTPNEQKLHDSQENLNKITDVLNTYMWIAYLQCLSTCLLCCGIALRYTHLVLQWIINSGLIFASASIVIIAFYYDEVPSFYWYSSMTIVYCTLAPVWMGIWYFMITYYSDQVKKEKIEMIKRSNIVKTHGGLTHIVDF